MLSYFRKRKLKKIVRHALADGELTDVEEDAIEGAQRALGIAADVVNDVRLEHFQRAVAPVLARVHQARRFSPADEQELHAIAQRLKVTPQFGDNLQIYRNLWEIETSGSFEPRPIAVPIRLTKSEACYHAAQAVWAQIKTVRRNHGYIGGSVGFRVAKGVTLRLGRAVPCVSEQDALVDISPGTLYVTSKRLVFVGDKKSTTITYGRLVSYELYTDGIEIKKSSGKSDVFRLRPEDIEFIDALFQVLS